VVSAGSSAGCRAGGGIGGVDGGLVTSGEGFNSIATASESDDFLSWLSSPVLRLKKFVSIPFRVPFSAGGFSRELLFLSELKNHQYFFDPEV